MRRSFPPPWDCLEMVFSEKERAGDKRLRDPDVEAPDEKGLEPHPRPSTGTGGKRDKAEGRGMRDDVVVRDVGPSLTTRRMSVRGSCSAVVCVDKCRQTECARGCGGDTLLGHSKRGG